jgi:arylsulfatase A-like enzyme
VQWKGKLPADKTYDEPVIQLDLHSTALAAAGLVRAVKEQTGPPLDGVDLLPHLLGGVKSPPHDALYWRFGEQTAIRSGNHKLVKARGGSGDWELYDLAADIGETKNLAVDKPDLAKDLLAKWDDWNSHNIKPLWGAPAAGGKGKAGLKKLLEKE